MMNLLKIESPGHPGIDRGIADLEGGIVERNGAVPVRFENLVHPAEGVFEKAVIHLERFPLPFNPHDLVSL